jgi:NAD(P)-dependent dehydrogenase (short-subunit alcohol dehydrogenase family)
MTSKGIGFAIVHRLSKNASDNTYLLGVRSGKAGEEAIQQLRDLEVAANLDILELDVTNDDQIDRAVEDIGMKFGKLDGWSSHPLVLTFHNLTLFKSPHQQRRHRNDPRARLLYRRSACNVQ